LPGAPANGAPAWATPDLAGMAVLIAAGSEIEAPLLARRLAAWGAQTRTVADPQAVAAALAEPSLAHRWGAILVDHALGSQAAGGWPRRAPARSRAASC
jgi:hypothetical protein